VHDQGRMQGRRMQGQKGRSQFSGEDENRRARRFPFPDFLVKTLPSRGQTKTGGVGHRT
jgi:hypothetical protein